MKPGATLVSWPDPLVAFAGSRLSQRQQFHLDEGASLVCVDSFTAGRVASGERWAMESLELRLSISSKGVSRFVDAQTLSPRHGSLEARLSGVEAMSTVVLTGPQFGALRAALAEDIGRGDATTLATIPPEQTARAEFLLKEPGVLSGLAVAARVFALLDPALQVTWTACEGEWREHGVIGSVTGPARALLSGERVAVGAWYVHALHALLHVLEAA